MPPSLPSRVTAILIRPREEWPAIAAEASSVGGLYARYIGPLAALGPAVLVLRTPGVGALALAVFQYAVQLAGLLLCARAIAWVAPRFESRGDGVQALKLLAYASTPSWLAAVVNVWPWLGTAVILAAALYGVYLYYLGLSSVMQTPAGHLVPFMLVSAILVLVVMTVFSALVGAVVGGTVGLASLTAG
jgi:hypothetical protein